MLSKRAVNTLDFWHDCRTALYRLQLEIHENAKAKGFYDTPLREFVHRFKWLGWLYKRLPYAQRNPVELIALEHSELSEALEAIRKSKPGAPLMSKKIKGFTNEEEELADLFIRGLDHAEHRELRLFDAILAKHEYNKGRSYKHGKQF